MERRNIMSGKFVLRLVSLVLISHETWHFCLVEERLHSLFEVLHRDVLLGRVKRNFKLFGINDELIFANVLHELIQHEQLYLIGFEIETLLKR